MCCFPVCWGGEGGGEKMHSYTAISGPGGEAAPGGGTPRPPLPPFPTCCCGRSPAGPGKRRLFAFGAGRGAAGGALLAAATNCTTWLVSTGLCGTPGGASGGGWGAALLPGPPHSPALEGGRGAAGDGGRRSPAALGLSAHLGAGGGWGGVGPSRALLAAPSPPSNAPPRGGSPPPLSRGSAGVAGRAKRCSASRTADRNSCGAEGGVGTTGPAPQRPPRPPSAPPAHLVSQIAVIAEAPLEAARLRAGGAVRGRHSARPPPLSPPGAPPEAQPPPPQPRGVTMAAAEAEVEGAGREPAAPEGGAAR